MRGSSLASRTDSLICPLCEVSKLYPSGQDSMRCWSCRAHVQGSMLESLRNISTLPDTPGSHACECGHPEMRLLPDGAYHCPSCGSEVLPIGAPSTLSKSDKQGAVFWLGWLDGRFEERSSFVENPNLAKWEAPSDRLDYYQGHRAGSEARQVAERRTDM